MLYSSVAVSGDGLRLVAVLYDYTNDDNSIATSSDGGASWIDTVAPSPSDWSKVALSNDAQYMYAVDTASGQLWRTTNAGGPWTVTPLQLLIRGTLMYIFLKAGERI